ncbi:MAG: peptidase U32 family protein, partial [Promethearchaeota archaeon]
MSDSKVELLTPAQNKKSVQAVLGHADAVYFGTETFNMRMNARNIKEKDLKDFVDFCHSNNIKAYLTTNIIIFDDELELLEELIKGAKDAEVDALIVHDFATIKMAKKYGIPFHISTQASVANILAAEHYEELGAERIILARELNLKQISAIAHKLKKAKVEAFVHGAMCTSISGRCYFSQFIMGSNEYSANRGRCVQPCRGKWRVIYEDGKGHEFDYDGFHFINAKDLCMIEYIPQLIEAGISSFKIEGRMRPAHYIEVVSKMYRKAIDSYYEGTFSIEKAKEWKKEMEKVYNRGFSTGFYFDIPTEKDVVKETSGNLATTRKEEIGRVLTFFRDKKVAKVVL